MIETDPFPLFVCPGSKRHGLMDTREHVLRPTGETKPYKAKKGATLGPESSNTSRQYTCLTCGHTGWTNHVSLEPRQ